MVKKYVKILLYFVIIPNKLSLQSVYTTICTIVHMVLPFFAAALELFSVQRQCSKHLNQADPHLRQALCHHCWVPHPRQQCHHCHCPAGHCPLGDSMTLIKPRCRFSETPPLPHLSPCSGFPTQHKLCYNKQKNENFIILFA